MFTDNKQLSSYDSCIVKIDSDKKQLSDCCHYSHHITIVYKDALKRKIDDVIKHNNTLILDLYFSGIHVMDIKTKYSINKSCTNISFHIFNVIYPSYGLLTRMNEKLYKNEFDYKIEIVTNQYNDKKSLKFIVE